jgi:signal transduction histidine kinase
MSIKAKQVAGVTTLVVVVVAVLSGYHLATLARLSLGETASRGEMLAQAIFQRAHEVVAQAGATDPYEALRADGGLRSILESSIGYSRNVTYAAIVSKDGVAVAHSFPSLEGQPMAEQEDLRPLVTARAFEQFRAVLLGDRTFEIRQPILAGDQQSGDQQFGDIRIGVSTLLVRRELRSALWGAAGTTVVALLVSSVFAMLLSQWMLRPIHVIQSGLSRLGRGELDVTLDLPEQEFRDLGSSFDAVSAQLSALGRAGSSDPATAELRPGGGTDLESVMDNLEDAVALFSPRGELIFSNAAMKALLSEIGADAIAGASILSVLPAAHPVKQLVGRTLAGRTSAGPISVTSLDTRPHNHENGGRGFESAGEAGTKTADAPAAERLLISHAIEDTSGRFLGAMLVARNLAFLSHVHSTLNYSRKLAALGRLLAGVAHEVKNPLNAMTIHLELLKQKLGRQLVGAPAAASLADTGSFRLPPLRQLPGDRRDLGAEEGRLSPDLTKHVDIISSEIRRLDEVVNGFLKFARPDELKLQPVRLGSLIADVATTAAPEAERRAVTLKTECPDALPEINADPGMLGQALLNLALNGCQAMPEGGTLKISCRAAARRRVEIDVEDTGVGIPPENLGRIFDLYFTTKEKGSGIGLSMVYRIVQLHGGEVEVQSTPGRGTRFRLIFPQA